ncbi:replication initiator protein A [Staphylococcus warneri]|uniref:replication initiator protein A n=1 Tax=Staphylococcus warneri TaxID=1292 RepID=UPI0022E30504|nr:replication initiator protein A [Staphylococcus warneri]
MTNEKKTNIIPFNEHINKHINLKTRQKCSEQKQMQSQPFYRLYRFLLFDEQYKQLQLKSKVMYTLLVDTAIYRSNNSSYQKDRNGNHYIEFDTDYFKEKLDISVNSVTKFKKELENYELIRVVSKQGKQRIYLNMPNITDNQFYYINNLTNKRKYTYIEVPKFLFEPEYDSITVESALIYSLLRDNQYISMKNSKTSKQFVDKHGDVFTKYSYRRLIDALNIKSKTTIKKHINTLVEHHLLIVSSIERKLTTLFKTDNRFYVLEPKEGINKQYDSNKTEENHKVHNNFISDSQKLNSSKNNSNNNINIKAQYISENDSQHLEVEMLKEQNTYLKRELDKRIDEPINEQDAIKKQLLKKFPSYISTIINAYTTDVHQVKRVMRIICGAKKLYQAFYKVSYTLEDVEREIGAALIRVNNKHKYNNKTIADVGNYLFESIKQVFIDQHQEDFENNRVPFSPDIGLCGDFELVYPEEIKSVG